MLYIYFPTNLILDGDMEYEELQRELEVSAFGLSEHRIESLVGILHRIYKQKTHVRRRQPKYGTLNMAFSDDDLERFLSCVKNGKFKLLFKMQAFCGLRIGEACKINIQNIHFDTRELIFISEKTLILDRLLIPDALFTEIIRYCEIYDYEIKASEGYLFFKDEHGHSKNGVLYIDKSYAAKVFRETRELAGLGDIYAHSQERTGKRSRPLYRLGTHSLRRYYATKIYRVKRDIVMTSKSLRHRNIGETIKYVANDYTELYANIDVAFNQGIRQQRLISSQAL